MTGEGVFEVILLTDDFVELALEGQPRAAVPTFCLRRFDSIPLQPLTLIFSCL